MRVPPSPPKQEIHQIGVEKLSEILELVPDHLIDGRYLHWDKVRYHPPPSPLTHLEWWFGIKFRRTARYKPLPLEDKDGESFKYVFDDPIPEIINRLDLRAGGTISIPEQVTSPETKDQYYVSSLIEEAITSSQLEGATTTRLIAKEMIRTGRPPRDKSERMILNNYQAMKRIAELKDAPLTKETVFDLHRIVTDGTLDDPSAAGRFRNPQEKVVVEGAYGEVYHVPPSAHELDYRMAQMCEFANGQSPDRFLHPLLRAIILHFWLSYDHPFVDGNGRTARALFYWSMLRGGYWLCEYISISHILRQAPIKYGRAFLHTETDGNDLTYFILFHLDVIARAINQLHDYISRKSKQLREVETQLRGLEALNHRQRALISHALRHPNTQYTILSHQTSHNVTYETARSDLMDLRRKRLLRGAKSSRIWYFTAESDLEARLADLSVFKDNPDPPPF